MGKEITLPFDSAKIKNQFALKKLISISFSFYICKLNRIKSQSAIYYTLAKYVDLDLAENQGSSWPS